MSIVNADKMRTETATADAQRAASMTPAQIEAEKKAKAEEDASLQRAGAVALALKKGMKNPDSFKLESAYLTKAGALCFEYRGTNSFNAVIPGYAVMSPDGKQSIQGSQETVARLWNKHCANTTGKELASVINTILS